jgi:hypothetical protein
MYINNHLRRINQNVIYSSSHHIINGGNQSIRLSARRRNSNFYPENINGVYEKYRLIGSNIYYWWNNFTKDRLFKFNLESEHRFGHQNFFVRSLISTPLGLYVLLYVLVLIGLQSLYLMQVPVECIGDLPSENLNTNNISTNSTPINRISTNHTVNVPEVGQLAGSINNLDNAAQALGSTIFSYAGPAATIAIGVSAATILKTLPPAGRAAALPFILGTTGGVAVLSNVLSKVSSANNSNISANEEDHFNNSINSVLETLSNTDQLILAIVLFLLSALYGSVALFFSFIIKEFNLEKQSFVISRPWLVMIMKYIAGSNKFTIFLLLFLMTLCLALALFSVLLLYSLLHNTPPS